MPISRVCVMAFVFSAALALPAAAGERTADKDEADVLTNKKIVSLLGRGFSEVFILRLIAEKPGDYDVSIDALAVLQEAKVSEAVMNAMLDAAKKQRTRKTRDVRAHMMNLATSDPDEYGRIVRRLVDKARAALPVLQEGLVDADPRVRAGTCEVMGKLRDARAVEPLFGMLEDPHPSVRAKAARALADTAVAHPNLNPSVSSRLLQLMSRPGMKRDGIAFALGYLAEERALDRLIAVVRGVGTAEDRGAAAFALGLIGKADGKVIETLMAAMLERQYGDIRESAVKALHRLSSKLDYDQRYAPKGVMSAMIRTYERYPQVRETVAYSIRVFNKPKVIELLLEALRSSNSRVVDNASDSLRYMTSQNFGKDYNEWSSWWEMAKGQYGVGQAQ